VFGQVCTGINKKEHSLLRGENRIFKVDFVGEGAEDAGGPYNEVISEICDEL
jgi:hypothetical protein